MSEFAMHDAARVGDLEKVRQLIEAGVPVDSLNEQGQTPLHRAADYGQYEVAQLLIDNKCNVNLKDRYGRTPVMYAAYWGLKDVVDLFLHCGAQVNCVDDCGCTLLLHACTSDLCSTDVVRLILDNGGAELNAADFSGRTPLIWAAIHGNEGVAALLVRAGADVNRSEKKWTALHFAVSVGRRRVMQILLEKEGLDISAQNDNGDTPLHIACSGEDYGNCECRQEAIKQLLDAGANTNVKNNRGETALSEGIRRGTLTHETIRLFVQKGVFLENCDYKCISQNNVLKENVLKDVELCTQSVVNKFNRQSLPALNSIGYFARRLPDVDTFKLGPRHIDEVKSLVQCEIERNTFCNVVKVRPIALSALCVLSLITCQSGKKQAAASDFGRSPLKKKAEATGTSTVFPLCVRPTYCSCLKRSSLDSCLHSVYG